MTDFVLYSDIHLHTFKFASKLVDDPEYGPINSRLLDGLNVLREIHNYALDNNIDKVVFAGDMFHIPEHTPTDVISIVYKELEKFHKAGLHLIMIPGNHDMANKSGTDHALVPFSGIATVATEYTEIFAGDDVFLHLVPFREHKDAYEKLLTAAKKDITEHYTHILISHAGIKGAKVGADYVLNSENDWDPAELQLLPFDAAFFGHFHLHQSINKDQAWYIGAPMQHNWGDTGDERGFLHVTAALGDVTFKRVLTNAPKFVSASYDHLEFTEKDFVRLLYHPETGPKPKLPCVPAHIDFVPIVVKATQKDVALPSTMSYEQVLASWLLSTNTSGIRKDKALKLGLELLAEALND